ncbi:MAG TPA: site-2 protease family protein [Vicinamibacterales bacterium]|nr:site-2 protease family protein [Vicinamibacterales bacterium]
MAGIDVVGILIQFVALLASLSVHEAAHAWSADRLGDPTARLLGRVTLNPAAHVDPIGTIVFPLIALFTRAPLIGWAKPVPVSVQNLRGNWRQQYMLIAAAGPASNLALAVGIAVIYRVILGSPFEHSGPGAQLVILLVQLNILLALFNLVPVPPLDGGNVLAGLLQGSAADSFERIRPYGILIIYGLMLTGVLWRVLGPIMETLISVLL